MEIPIYLSRSDSRTVHLIFNVSLSIRLSAILFINKFIINKLLIIARELKIFLFRWFQFLEKQMIGSFYRDILRLYTWDSLECKES